MTYTKATFNSRQNIKQILYIFTPAARGIIRGTNEILRKNYNDMRLYRLII